MLAVAHPRGPSKRSPPESLHPARAVSTGGRVEPSVSVAEANAAGQVITQVRESEPRVAAYVQAANHLLALEPMLVDHVHRLRSFSSWGTGPLDNDSTLVISAWASTGVDALAGTKGPSGDMSPSLAPASRPVAAALDARIAELEVLLGSLRWLAPRLEALTSRFVAHTHAYQFQWGPVGTLDRGDVMILYAAPVSGLSETEAAAVSVPVIDFQGPLPNPGVAMPQLAWADRVATIISQVADLEPLYARVSAAARAFAGHVHHAPLGCTLNSLLRQPASAATALVAFVSAHGSVDPSVTRFGRGG